MILSFLEDLPEFHWTFAQEKADGDFQIIFFGLFLWHILHQPNLTKVNKAGLEDSMLN